MANKFADAYLIVVPVPAYRLSDCEFAIEGAFAAHLHLLRNMLGSIGRNMVLACPSMTQSTYDTQKNNMAVIHETDHGIRFNGVYPANLGRLGYLKHLPQTLRELKKEVTNAAVVHAGNSPLYRPFEFPALVFGLIMKKRTISVTDIDHRQSAKMNLATGHWSLKQYLVTRLLHDPFQHFQQWFGVRGFSLVLIKGSRLALDYGRNRSNVKFFLDSAFSARHIISKEMLYEKIATLRNSEGPVELIYFGRLVEYKGIDHMLGAVHRALKLGSDVLFHIVGDGPQKAKLVELSGQLNLGDRVSFHGSLPFGDALFALLYRCHILLAAPLSEDTPRSALDAMASGQVLIGYDTYYYRELEEMGASIHVVPWRDVEKLGQQIANVAGDRKALADKLSHSVEFARHNTQEIWLERRVNWTRALFPADVPRI